MRTAAVQHVDVARVEAKKNLSRSEKFRELNRVLKDIADMSADLGHTQFCQHYEINAALHKAFREGKVVFLNIEGDVSSQVQLPQVSSGTSLSTSDSCIQSQSVPTPDEPDLNTQPQLRPTGPTPGPSQRTTTALPTQSQVQPAAIPPHDGVEPCISATASCIHDPTSPYVFVPSRSLCIGPIRQVETSEDSAASRVCVPSTAVPAARVSIPSMTVPATRMSMPSTTVPAPRVSVPSAAVPAASMSVPSTTVPTARVSVPSTAVPAGRVSIPSTPVLPTRASVPSTPVLSTRVSIPSTAVLSTRVSNPSIAVPSAPSTMSSTGETAPSTMSSPGESSPSSMSSAGESVSSAVPVTKELTIEELRQVKFKIAPVPLTRGRPKGEKQNAIGTPKDSKRLKLSLHKSKNTKSRRRVTFGKETEAVPENELTNSVMTFVKHLPTDEEYLMKEVKGVHALNT